MPEMQEAYESSKAKRGPGRPPKDRRTEGFGNLGGGDTGGDEQQGVFIIGLLEDIRTLLEHMAYTQSSAMVDKEQFLARYVYATPRRLDEEDPGDE